MLPAPATHSDSVAQINDGSREFSVVRELALIVGASLFVGLCAKVTWYLPFSPVPLTLSNFGVLLVGLLLGGRRGAAALALYLVEGSAGLPVFTAGSLGIFGPTGGYLLAYPAVAFLAGWLQERGRPSFPRYVVACSAGEILLFAAGVSWLVFYFHRPWSQGAALGLYPFIAGEVLKVSAAAAIANRFHRKLS